MMKSAQSGWAGTIIAGLLAAGFGHAAQAGDLGPGYQAYDWTGYYAGVAAGGGLLDSSTGDPNHDIWDNDVDLTEWGGTLGVALGYSKQFGAGVLGVEGDINWTGFDNEYSLGSSSDYVRTEWNWFATFRGRAGLAVDRALIYATAGVAFVDVDYFTTSNQSTGCSGTCIRASETKTGFVLGGGAEYAFNGNLSAKFEYLYINIPDEKISDEFVFNSSAQLARVGLNWHFGAGAQDGGFAAPSYQGHYRGYDWTGFYVGGAAGGGLLNSSTGDTDHDIWDNDVDLTEWGGVAGGTLGYSKQFGAGVLGVEGDINWTGFDNEYGLGSSSDYVRTEWNWFATVRGRAGLAADRTLIYATAGIAFVDVDYFTTSNQSAGCSGSATCARASETKTGFVFGGGAEYALNNNLSVKLEYLYINIPDERTFTNDPDEFVFNSNAQLARVGLNWHLGAQAGGFAAPSYQGYDWAGFYVGGTAGGGVLNSSTGDPNLSIWDNDVDLTEWGGVAGGTLGYSKQFGAGVLGVEGDINWTGLENEYSRGSSSDYVRTEWNWFATVRARAGLAMDRALIYATAGVAFVDVDYFSKDNRSQECSVDFECARAGEIKTGLAFGGGAEYALNSNLSVKLEYLYINIPDERVLTTDDEKFVFNSNAQLGRVGLNWHF
jgi:opacity protein-like surface antigen